MSAYECVECGSICFIFDKCELCSLDINIGKKQKYPLAAPAAETLEKEKK